MTQTIYPRTYEDYMAVLSFSYGITDKQEIERFFDFAQKVTLLVRVMIKKVLVQRLSREYLEGIKEGIYSRPIIKVQGIQFADSIEIRINAKNDS